MGLKKLYGRKNRVEWSGWRERGGTKRHLAYTYVYTIRVRIIREWFGWNLEGRREKRTMKFAYKFVELFLLLVFFFFLVFHFHFVWSYFIFKREFNLCVTLMCNWHNIKTNPPTTQPFPFLSRYKDRRAHNS